MSLHLLVDELPVLSDHTHAGWMRFRVNLPAQEIRIISPYAGSEECNSLEDRRQIGAALLGIKWRQRDSIRRVSVESPDFIDGFYYLERSRTDDKPFRWTNGNAGLPPTIVPPWHGETELWLHADGGAGAAAMPSRNPNAGVMGGFDSLGDNCELALAQRHYGVELPLGLLRWSGTDHGKLLAGLSNGFEGLGIPETTKVVWNTTDYRLETPYLSMHTTVIEQRNEDDLSDIHHAGCATLRLLRRKLLRDIADARRIFVFRTEDRAFGPPEMRALHTALRGLGPASLLCVTRRREQPDSRDVLRLADGLYWGCLDRFVIPDGPFDRWLDLCVRTSWLHRTGTSSGTRR